MANRARGFGAFLSMAAGLVCVSCGPADTSEHVGLSQGAVHSGQSLIIRQVYGRPSTPTAAGTFSRGFVEIYNRGHSPASLGGFTLNAGSYSGLKQIALPAVSLAPGQSFLVAGLPVDNSPDLPNAPDLLWTGPAPFVLLEGSVRLSGTDASGTAILDTVGFGNQAAATPREGIAAPALTNTTALHRKQNGVQDTNQNSQDFSVGVPTPRNYFSSTTVPNAPALDTTTGTSFASMTKFIYSGANPVQTDVTTTIADERAGWLLGTVAAEDGSPLSGVTVTIAGQSKYGKTLTRNDGRFDLIVNGGERFTIRFEKDGYYAADRQTYVGWEETSGVSKVVLLTKDTASQTPITLGNANAAVSVTGPTATDEAGERTPKIVVPPLVTATIGAPGRAPGTGTPAPTLTLRMKEYTIGANGPARMPAPLPPTSGYTYAVEISADEALALQQADEAGATQQVVFSDDVYVYLDNFMDAPVGKIVPSGYYDRDKLAWLPSKGGLVVKIVSVNSSGVAQLDVDGDDVVDNSNTAKLQPLKVTPAELARLGGLYPGASHKKLWRVPIKHLTPYDFNFGRNFDCDGACQTPPLSHIANGDIACESEVAGSIIGCESQSLGERTPVAGTPFTLNYRSSRAPLSFIGRRMRLGIREIPENSKIAVEVALAGKRFEREFAPGPATTWEFVWDGLDGGGRPVVGSVSAAVTTRWDGKAEYLVLVDEFGRPPTSSIVVGSSWRQERRWRPFSYESREVITLTSNPPLAGVGSWSLGGWTLNAHHFYDVKGKKLFLGSGQTRPVAPSTYVVKTVLGSGGGDCFRAEWPECKDERHRSGLRES